MACVRYTKCHIFWLQIMNKKGFWIGLLLLKNWGQTARVLTRLPGPCVLIILFSAFPLKIHYLTSTYSALQGYHTHFACLRRIHFYLHLDLKQTSETTSKIWSTSRKYLLSYSLTFRAVVRSENPGVPVLFDGHNLPPPLVEIGLTDLSKSGGTPRDDTPDFDL